MSTGAVTAGGIRIREMRLLIHRGQALLLLVVVGLAAAAVAAAGLEHDGLPTPVVALVSGVLSPPHRQLPAKIEIADSPDGPWRMIAERPLAVQAQGWHFGLRISSGRSA